MVSCLRDQGHQQLVNAGEAEIKACSLEHHQAKPAALNSTTDRATCSTEFQVDMCLSSYGGDTAITSNLQRITC